MHNLACNHNIAERCAHIFAHGLIVVARNEKNLVAVPRAPEQFLHYRILGGRPVDSAPAHRP
jgi:hypothetical protein